MNTYFTFIPLSHDSVLNSFSLQPEWIVDDTDHTPEIKELGLFEHVKRFLTFNDSVHSLTIYKRTIDVGNFKEMYLVIYSWVNLAILCVPTAIVVDGVKYPGRFKDIKDMLSDLPFLFGKESVHFHYFADQFEVSSIPQKKYCWIDLMLTIEKYTLLKILNRLSAYSLNDKYSNQKNNLFNLYDVLENTFYEDVSYKYEVSDYYKRRLKGLGIIALYKDVETKLKLLDRKIMQEHNDSMIESQKNITNAQYFLSWVMFAIGLVTFLNDSLGLSFYAIKCSNVILLFVELIVLVVIVFLIRKKAN